MSLLVVCACSAGHVPIVGQADACLAILVAWDAKLAACRLTPADPAKMAHRRQMCREAVGLLLDAEACERALDELPCEALKVTAVAPPECRVPAL
jgi:hypothetical protein